MSEVTDVAKLAAAVETCKVVEAPDGSKHVVARESYEVTELPKVMEGQRLHHFDDVRSFAEWMVKHGEGSAAEILVASNEISAVLKPAEAEPEVVSCKLVLHPAFKAWVDVLGHEMRLPAFHDLTRGFAEYVTESTELLTALRGFKLIRGGEFTQTIDELGAIRLIGSTEKAEVQVKVPAELTVRTPVFCGIESGAIEQTYDLRLFISMDLGTTGNATAFTLSCPGLPLVMKEAREDAAAFAREQLGSSFLVGLGEVHLHHRPKVE